MNMNRDEGGILPIWVIPRHGKVDEGRLMAAWLGAGRRVEGKSPTMVVSEYGSIPKSST